MIAVQTDERLYLLKMEDSEFVNLIMQETLEGRNVEERLIPLIRARSSISFNSNDMVRLVTSMLPEISTCYSKVGNRFDTKPVSSTEDLEFFIAPNGNQYSCEEAYTDTLTTSEELSSTIPNPVTAEEKVEEIPTPVTKVEEVVEAIPNPVVAPIAETKVEEVSQPEIKADNEPKKEEELYLGVVPGEQVHKATGEVIALPASLTDDFYKQAEVEQPATGLVPIARVNTNVDESDNVEEETLETIQIREEQKRAASQLDNIVRNLPNVASLPEEFLWGMVDYVNSQKDVFREYASEYLGNVSPLDRDELLTDFPVPNALGTSTDMADSLLVFPVYTRILAKRDLRSRFSSMDLINSTMLRVCPIGIDGEKIQSYVQEIRITSQDIKEAQEKVNAELKKQNKAKRSLTAEEKYVLLEEALEEIYKNRKGSLAASKETKLVEDLGKYFDKLVTASKVYIPSLEEWSSYDVMAFDARVKVEQFPTPLLTQLQTINGKTREEIETLFGELEESYTTEYDRVVSIPMIDASEEAIRSGATMLGFTEIQEAYLSDEEKACVVVEDGKRILKGFYYDKNSQSMLDEETFKARCKRVNGKSSDTVIVGGPEDDPFEEEPEEKNRTIKVRQVDTSAFFEEENYIDVTEDFINDAVRLAIVETADGLELDGYCYDAATGQMLTTVEYDEIMKKKLAEDAKKIFGEESAEEKGKTPTPAEQTTTFIPNPVISPVVKKEEDSQSPLLKDRKYRMPVRVSIPTVFSQGETPEKIERIPNYQEYVSLSEDDMVDELKKAIRATADGGYTLEGYCYDYDQVKIITEEEYLEAQSHLVAPAPKAPEQPQETPEFKPIVSAVNVSMGGVPLDSSDVKKGPEPTPVKPAEPTVTSAPTTEAAPLVDYVKPDGTYVDPTGGEWSSKDEYTLYKMLLDDEFLGEQEKGKQF